MFGESEGGTFVSYNSDDYLTGSQKGTFELLTKNGNVLGFNTDGWVEYLHDNKGNSIKLIYDTQKNLVSVQYSSGDIFKFEYGDNGKISRFIDHAGRFTTYSYDPTGQLLSSVTTPDGRQTQYNYISRIGGYALSSVNYPDNTGYTVKYDDSGNPIEQSQSNGKSKIGYNYDPAARTTQITDDYGNTGKITLDLNGQIVSSESNNKDVTRFVYDEKGMISAVTDALGRSSRFNYDDKGNIVAITDPLDHTTRLTYDGEFNILSSISDARGSTLQFTYDNKGNLIRTTYPDSRSESYDYDSKGNLIRKTTRNGITINYQNDNRGQLTKTEYPDGSFTAYTYDADGNVLTLANRDGTILMVYNPGNQLTEIHYPDGNSFKYIYDTVGRLTQRIEKDGYTTIFAYDDNGNLIKVSDGNANVIVKYSYDTAGRLVRKDVRNGAYTTYTYDSSGQISRLVNYNKNGSILSRFDYQYDTSGNPVSVDTLEGKYQYGYDILGQLVKVTYPDGQVTQYSYDAAGNRISVVNSGITTSYTTNAMNQYTQAGPASFSYDANGNLISKAEGGKTTTYQYNYDNRLIKVTSPEGIKEYIYDALGNRVGVNQNGNRIRYSVDPLGLGDVVAEYDGSGSFIARYTHGIGLVSKIDASGNEYAYIFDQNQDTIQIMDSSGKEVNRYQYSPFGEYRQKVEGIPNPFTYVGEYGVMDDGKGTYYMRMRNYDPNIGRFIIPDPIFINGGSLNLYTYALNNPIKYSDVSGLRIDLNSDSTNNPMGWTPGGPIPVNYNTQTGYDQYKTRLINYGRITTDWAKDYEDMRSHQEPSLGKFPWFKFWRAAGRALSGSAAVYSNHAGANTGAVAGGVGYGVQQGAKMAALMTYGIITWQHRSYQNNPGIIPWSPQDDPLRNTQKSVRLSNGQTSTWRTPQDALNYGAQRSGYTEFKGPNNNNPNPYSTISQEQMKQAIMHTQMVFPGNVQKNLETVRVPYGFFPDNGGGGGGIARSTAPGGVDFSNIQMNSLLLSNDSDAQVFSYTLKTTITQPGETADDIENASALSFKAFFTGLALPNSVFWVNLNTREPDRIIDKNLATTDVGRIMLVADLDMKKDYARYLNGCVYPVGEEYRKITLQKETELLNTLKSKYPDESEKIGKIHFTTTIGHWIGPDRMDVHMNKDQIFIDNLSLTITVNPTDDLSGYKISGQNSSSGLDSPSDLSLSDALKEDLNVAAKEYLRNAAEQVELTVTPLVIKEVNTAPKYADLRRVYSSLALAQWYKEKYRGTNGIFSDKIDTGDLTGLNSSISWNFQDTYQAYVRSFKELEFHCQVNLPPVTMENGTIFTVENTYGVGGVVFSKIPYTTESETTPEIDQIMKEAIFQESPSSQYSDPLSTTSESNKIAITGTTKDNVVYAGDSIFFINNPVKKSPIQTKTPYINTKNSRQSLFPTGLTTTLLIIIGAVVIGIAILIKLKSKEDYEDDNY
jgi:RHS repeat-associated protein